MPTLVVIGVILSEALLLVPLSIYLRIGRTLRRDEILSYFSATAIAQYFQEFWYGRDHYGDLANAWLAQPKPADFDEAQARSQLKAAFRDLYDHQFGLRLYVYPVLLLALIIGVEGYFTVQTGVGLAREAAHGPVRHNFHIKLDPVTLAAITGAYLWVVGDVINRVRIKDLVPADIYGHCLRLLIAAPMGSAIGVIVGQDKAPFVAFGIGAFPLSQISDFLRTVTARTLQTPVTAQDESPDRLTNLQGINSAVASRLADEGITTIKQLLCADPVQLRMRTHFELSLVTDLVGQAIAWDYLGTTLLKLHPFGIVGSSDIIDLHAARPRPLPSPTDAALAYARAKQGVDEAQRQLDASPGDAGLAQAKAAADAELASQEAVLGGILSHHKASAVIDAVAAELKLNIEGLKHLAEQIATDPYARFIYRMQRAGPPPPL